MVYFRTYRQDSPEIFTGDLSDIDFMTSSDRLGGQLRSLRSETYQDQDYIDYISNPEFGTRLDRSKIKGPTDSPIKSGHIILMVIYETFIGFIILDTPMSHK